MTHEHTQVEHVIETYETELSRIQAAYEEAAKKMQEAFAPLFSAFFEKNPEVLAVGWTQYTPSFNDGDPCVFRRSDVGVLLQSDDELRAALIDSGVIGDDEDIDDVEFDVEEVFYSPDEWDYADTILRRPKVYARNPSEGEAKVAAWKQAVEEAGFDLDRMIRLNDNIDRLRDLLKKFPPEVYEKAFGDGAKIIATSTGIDVTEYDCGY